MNPADSIRVEVAYATPERQPVYVLAVAPGTTLEQAVRASGVLRDFPEIELQRNRVGVFGKLAHVDRVLQDGDRVEIYRPLIGDPKEIRRRRAAEGRTMGKRGA